MTATEPQTVLIGVFATHAQAEQFVEELRRAGFRDDQFGVATPHTTDRATRVEETALVGAISGGTVGIFAGVAMALGIIPGIGPVLAGGVLAGLLGGVAVGATAGGLIGALIGLGVSEAHARRYEQHLREGRTLVVVKAAERYGEALDILHRCESHEPPPRRPSTSPPGVEVLDELT
jgi:hypothetical protein